MASNTVDIYFKGHNSGLTRSIAEVQSKLRQLRDQTIRVKVDVDSSSLDQLQRRIRTIGSETLRIRVGTEDARGLRQNVRDLAASREARVRVNVTNLAQTEAQLQRLTRDRTVNIRTRVNVSEIDRLVQALNRLNDAGGGAGGAARGITALGGAAASTLPKLVALAPAVSVLASGAVGAGIFGVAGALGAVTAAAGALSVGFGAAVAAIPIAAAAASDQVKNHFSFMADDVVATMKEIAVPLQQPLVDLATSLGAAFHQIRPNLESITTGVAGLVTELSGKLPAIAAEVGPALQSMFEGAVPHIKNFIGNMPSLIKSVGSFAAKLGDPAIVAGAQRVFSALPGIIEGAGNALVGMGEKFQGMMSYLDSGALDGFTSGIGTFVENLRNTDMSGLAAGITEMANSFGSFLGNVDTSNLVTNLQGLATTTASITAAAGSALAKFQELDNAVRGANDASGGGPVEWGGKLADGVKAAIANLAGNGPVEVPVVPKLEGDPIDGQIARNGPVEVPLTGVLDPTAGQQLRNMPPVPVPATIGPVTPPVAPIAPIPIPATVENVEQPTTPMEPVEVPGTIAEVDVNIAGIDPVPVPVKWDTDQLGTLTITPPEPVPISFVVTPPDLSAVNVDMTAKGAEAGASFAAGLASSAGAVSGAVAGLAAAAQSVSVDLSAQGAAAGASFAAGIASQAGAVAAAAANLGAVAAANKGHYAGRKGIAADRIMLIPHGRAMVGGFVRGMVSQKGAVVSAARGLAGEVYTAFDDELVPAIGLRGGMDIQQTVHVTVEAGLVSDPVRTGRAVADVLDAYAGAIGSTSVSVNV
ncbi:hypothetical protein [Rhodococcus sp. SORGH_AS_0303]|uniref:hypothetical protein n=1 Tax=Rhodococcus sp. SORGH_AS_0303 TaxID=3041753 RepID=UPI002782AFE5|nr:hypothetical protein [Rhodococcus sp. SORGH_AS_0303]MDQ1202853.1 hypothetical protein [Rhodococcus sp. SORGH_AS_0303]